MSVETLKNGALRNAFPDGRPERLEGAGGDMMAMAVSLFDGVAAKVRLTPDRLVNIITQADCGDPREQAVLFSTVLEKEPIVASHLQTRRLAVQSCPWSIQSKAQPSLAEEIQEELLRAGIKKAIGHLLDCIGTGYSGVVVDWAKGGAGINGFVPISPDVWTFDEGGYPAITTIDGKNEVPLAKYHPAQILYVVNDGKAGLPCRKGVLRTLLWMHLFKNSSFRDWAVFLERFGIPFILGKIPSGDFFDVKKREELLKGIMGIRSGGAGVGTVETEMQILNGASSGNQQAYESFQRYCDEIMTLVILGQRASSDAAGGLSKGTAQEAVRQDLLAADCGVIEEAVQKTCVEWLCRLKHGMADAGDIRFKIDCALPEDMNTRAERDLKISQATGCRLSRKYAMETYGVELEEPTPPPDPLAQMRQGEFSDRPFDLAARRREAAWRLTRATVRRMMDEDVFEAWRGPIEAAARRAFGDIDPEAEDAIEQFGKRVPDFLAALPGILDHFAPDEFCRVMRGGVLASFLNSLPPNTLRRNAAAFADWNPAEHPREDNGRFCYDGGREIEQSDIPNGVPNFARTIIAEKGIDAEFLTPNEDGTYNLDKSGRHVVINGNGVEVMQAPLKSFPGTSPGRNIDNLLLHKKHLKAIKKHNRNRQKEYLMEQYNSKVGLHHDGLTESAVTLDTMGHCIHSRLFSEKAEVLCSHGALDALFRAGMARQEPIVFVDKHALAQGAFKIDNEKLNWAECWHITGKATINGVKVSYDFTVKKRMNDNQFEVYDLSMDRQ